MLIERPFGLYIELQEDTPNPRLEGYDYNTLILSLTGFTRYIKYKLFQMLDILKAPLVLYLSQFSPVFISFKTQRWEIFESTVIPCGVEPLKKAPEKAKHEVLAQCLYLLPEMYHCHCKWSCSIWTRWWKLFFSQVESCHKKNCIDILCKFGTLRCMKTIDEICSGCAAWIGQLVVNNHNLKQ